MNVFNRLLAVTLAAALSSSCAYNTTIPRGFYRPGGATPEKSPVKVTVGPGGYGHYRSCMGYLVGPLLGMDFNARVEPALTEALRVAVDRSFQTAPPGAADFTATASIASGALDVAFTDPDGFAVTYGRGLTSCKEFTTLDILAMAFTLFLANPPIVGAKGAAGTSRLKGSLSRSLDDIVLHARTEGKLLSHAKARARFLDLEAKGDGAGRKDDAAKRYLEALGVFDSWNRPVKRVLGKYAALVPALEAPPEVTEDARKLVVQGQTLAKDAKDKAQTERAVATLRQAARSAPWWPSVYFNLGVASEGLAKACEAANDAAGARAAYQEAVDAYAFYLASDPDAKDAAETRTRSYALEAKTK